MQIKDVEKLTGLTAKSIRFYEEKGLISVERNRSNTYRVYTGDNVATLKQIKILRYFGFSVAELDKLLKLDKSAVKLALQERAEKMEEERNDQSIRLELFHSFIKEYDKENIFDIFCEDIDFIASEDYDELKNDLLDMTVNSVWTVIVQSLMLLGPILTFFIRVSMRNYDAIGLIGGFSMLASIWIAFLWRGYFKDRKTMKKRVKAKNRKEFWLIPIGIIAFIISIATYIGISTLQEKLIMPSEWLFFEANRFWGLMMIGSVGLFITYWCQTTLKIYDLPKGKKWFFTSLGITLFLCYQFLTNLTVVTEDKVLVYSSLNLTGTSYDYKDVSKIHAYYGNSPFQLATNNQSGTFYYAIWLGGKKLVLSQPTPNENIKKYHDDTYFELETFDQRLVDLGITKESSEKGANRVQMDQVYKDRFLRIIRNK